MPEAAVAWVKSRSDEDGGAWDRATIGELNGIETVVDDRESRDTSVDDPDASRLEAGPFGGGDRLRVREEDEVVRPLSEKVSVIDRAGVGREHAERLVADFPPVAVGTMEEVATPALAGARDVRQLVDGACRESSRRAVRRRPPASRSTKPLVASTAWSSMSSTP